MRGSSPVELDSGKKTITSLCISFLSGRLIIFFRGCLVCNIYVFNNTRMVLTLGIHSRMGVVSCPNVTKISVSQTLSGWRHRTQEAWRGSQNFPVEGMGTRKGPFPPSCQISFLRTARREGRAGKHGDREGTGREPSQKDSWALVEKDQVQHLYRNLKGFLAFSKSPGDSEKPLNERKDSCA